MKIRPQKLNLALESVDFQSRAFGDRITSLVSAIFDKFDNGEITSSTLAREQEITLLEDLIFREKGLRVKFVVNSELAAIMPVYLNKNSIFIDELWRGNFTIKNQEEIIKNAANKKGTVDLKKGRVGGLFSEGTSILYINFYVLKAAYSMKPAEVAAVILHELGHAFSSFEFSDRLTTTNQVLAQASREIFKKNGKKNLDYVFKEIKSINKDVTIEEIDAIVNGDRIVAGVRWHKLLIDTVASELQNAKYSENSFEQMADNFASRHGYGKELVIALDKLYLASGAPEKYGFMRWLSYTVSAISLILMPFIIIGAITTAPIMALLLGTLVFFSFLGSGDKYRDNTYDELKQRYIRVRAEIVTLLKDINLSKQAIEEAVSQIKVLDRVIENTKDVPDAWRALSNVVFSSNRAAMKDINYQKQIEGLVNNNLFVAAAQLRNA